MKKMITTSVYPGEQVMVSDLKHGIYLYRIYSNEKSIHGKLIIK
jgi:hypothetical protein